MFRNYGQFEEKSLKIGSFVKWSRLKWFFVEKHIPLKIYSLIFIRIVYHIAIIFRPII